jgi:tight adherence protein B
VNLAILSLLIFVVTLALVASGIYFFVELPGAKKKMRSRLDVVRDLAVSPGAEAQILRTDVLSNIPLLNKLLAKIPIGARLQLFLQQADMEMTPGMLLTLVFLLAWVTFLSALLAGLPFLVTLFLGALVGGFPFIIISAKRQRRFFKFEEAFPDAIELLGRAVRAGHAFTTGLDLIAKEMAPPLSEEFRKAYEQQNLGLPLRDALQSMTVRMPLPDVRIFVTALLIQRESGGNLAEVLDNLAHVIRERFKVMRQIKVFTAQGRLTLYMLISVPPIIGVLLYFIDSEYVMRLFTDPMGHQMLIGAVVLQTIGYFVIRKIIQPKF